MYRYSILFFFTHLINYVQRNAQKTVGRVTPNNIMRTQFVFFSSSSSCFVLLVLFVFNLLFKFERNILSDRDQSNCQQVLSLSGSVEPAHRLRCDVWWETDPVYLSAKCPIAKVKNFIKIKIVNNYHSAAQFLHCTK